MFVINGLLRGAARLHVSALSLSLVTSADVAKVFLSGKYIRALSAVSSKIARLVEAMKNLSSGIVAFFFFLLSLSLA